MRSIVSRAAQHPVTANGIKIVGLIPGTGYGDQACEVAAGLDAKGIDVSWLPTVDDTADVMPLARAMEDAPSAIASRLEPLWNSDVEASALFVQVPPYRWHAHWREAEPGLRHYCYLPWEVDKIPPDWIAPLNGYDKVLVPTQFNRKAFLEGGVTTEIVVSPHFPRLIVPGGDVLALDGIREHDYVFYTIGAWTSRKDIAATARAYLNAFTADDDVVLVIKTESYDQIAYQNASRELRGGGTRRRLTTAWTLATILAGYKNPARINLISNKVSPGQIDQLHLRGQCFVSLTHSEGWGLGAFDAARSGNPVIITGWGGQLEYLGEEYPFLVDYTLEQTAQYVSDGYFYQAPDVHWAHANDSHASELMRSVYEGRSAATVIGTALKATLEVRYNTDTLATELAATLGF
ncbi:MAG: glycosyltransferase involved in cell wall biosynthesis [Halieaceae bacterium]